MADGSMQHSELTGFAPGEGTRRDLRQAFGQFATGVTVVTVRTPQGPVGMTANSFSSVSLDPPLVLWCPAKDSSRYAAFAAAPHFAVHVLAAGQEEVAIAFARRGDAFAGLDVAENAEGVPLLRNCLARFECSTEALHDAGDHALMVGRVAQVAMRDGRPLVFCQGVFGAFDMGGQKANE